MDIKLISIPLVLLTTGCIANDRIEKTEFQLFQDYALSACIANGYKDGDIYSDSVSALNGYRARSRLPLEAFSSVQPIIEKWLSKPYKTRDGSTTEIAACLDLVKSEDLLAIFARHTPCKDASSWRDKNEYEVRCNGS